MCLPENYGSVLKDCSRAIAVNLKSFKAYYRSSLALNALERYDEAIDCCERCLQYDPNNKSVQGVRERATQLKETKGRKEKEKQEKLRQERLREQRLREAYNVSMS